MAVMLFDLFGVIARHQSSEGRARLERVFGGSDAAFWDTYWAAGPPYDRGDQSGPDYWRTVAHKLSAPVTDHRIAQLIAADVASWSGVDEEMVAYLGSLRDRNVRLGLLSNIPEELAAHYERQHAWLGLFDTLASSCRIRCAKPEAGAHDWCVRAVGVPASDILFVDDRAENVEAARAAGMQGHVFTSLAGLRHVEAV